MNRPQTIIIPGPVVELARYLAAVAGISLLVGMTIDKINLGFVSDYLDMNLAIGITASLFVLTLALPMSQHSPKRKNRLLVGLAIVMTMILTWLLWLPKDVRQLSKIVWLLVAMPSILILVLTAAGLFGREGEDGHTE